MSIGEYLLLLRRRWRIWVAGLVLGITAALLVNVLAPKSYTASATSFVTVAAPEVAATAPFQNSQFVVQRVKSYVILIRSARVLEPVVQEVAPDLTVPELRAKASATSPLETSVIQVSVVDRDPALARDLANALSKRLAQVVTELETPAGSDQTQVRIDLTNPAETPGAPSFPAVKLNLALGALFGLGLGLVGAVLRQQLDRRIKTRDDIREVAGTSPLGVSLRDSSLRRHPVLDRNKIVGIEAFRTIRTGLRFATVDSRLQHFAITSSVASEGKSVLACNLAVSWAVSGASVCLVECDLRRPEITHYLGLEGAVGLSDVLVGEAVLNDVLMGWNRGLISVLPAGSLPPDPTALLDSAAMRALVTTLKSSFDVVIYDTPPVLAVADALVMSEQLDGAILLVRSGRTTRDQLGRALDTLSKAKVNLLGTVLTFEPASKAEDYKPVRRSAPTIAEQEDHKAASARPERSRSGSA